jgi:histidine triad (HIT) family protein
MPDRALNLIMPCIFCEIVARRAPADIIFQDDHVTAFTDVNPRAPTHILVVPNTHIESVDGITDESTALDVARCLSAARVIARERDLTSGGYRLVTNTGRGAGQSVFHLHFHLLAGRKFTWPPG